MKKKNHTSKGFKKTVAGAERGMVPMGERKENTICNGERFTESNRQNKHYAGGKSCGDPSISKTNY